MRLLAFCAGAAVNAIQAKHDSADCDRLAHADALAAALEMDMTRWFTPVAENFFERISKAQIAEAMTEAGKAPDSVALAMKKAQLAKLAELKIAGTGWLPAPVRVSSHSHDDRGSTSEESATTSDDPETEGAS